MTNVLINPENRMGSDHRQLGNYLPLDWTTMKERVTAVALGLLGGYLAYLPIMLAYEKWAYGRWDSEKVFWALYCPLLSPYLVSVSTRQTLSLDEARLVPIGGGLLILAILLSLWRTSQRRVTDE
jgi:hypothetical protein